MNRVLSNRALSNRLRGLLPVLLACAVASSCTSSSPEGATSAVVVSQIGFGARTGDEIDGIEVAVGLDIDGRTSDTSDELGCKRRDFMAPDGRAGIDNQFTFLYETVAEVFQDGVVEGIIQNSINEGRLLLMYQLSGVDDPLNDDEVEVAIFLGEGRPDLNSNNRIVGSQTFDRRLDASVTTTRGRIVDGVLETDAFDIEMPMAFFNVFFDLQLSEARIRGEMHEDGGMVGVLAGAVSMEQIYEIGRMADGAQELQITPTLQMLLPRWADLLPGDDGRCTHLSAALTFESVPAFVYEDVAP
ncbi:MAG: hypothetical protein H6722_24060 [Sandaracinus sp.]|nr:hypothetical protein [Sandaracinus sp.]MCB9615517.1 hypothetical protein [Sandaracinus sp.]MCB9619960.1 hypothetical protein [Sandaracinus sp.]